MPLAGFEPIAASGCTPTPYTARPMGWTLPAYSFTDASEEGRLGRLATLIFFTRIIYLFSSSFFFFFTLRMRALQPFLTSVTIHQSKRRNAPGNWNLIQWGWHSLNLLCINHFIRDILILQTPLEWLLPIRPPAQNLQRLRYSTKLE